MSRGFNYERDIDEATDLIDVHVKYVIFLEESDEEREEDFHIHRGYTSDDVHELVKNYENTTDFEITNYY